MKIKVNLLTCSLVTTLLTISTCSEDENLFVETSKGRMEGFKELTLEGREFYSFLGIPFAKPPLGPLRFKDPIEPDRWEKTLDVTEHPEVCLQYTMMAIMMENPEPRGSEDCLYLNVFTPSLQDKARPVMVFIHGGGYMAGSASEYKPYVLLDQEIVFVALQYRLNIFGFLSTDDDVMPGNYGLKDQNLALRWVKQNIAKFGGDPDNVTIFGESAGGSSVHLQMLSPWSQGLFQRVIAQSGMGICPWSVNQNHRKTALDFGQLTGCQLGTNSEEYVECLQNIDDLALLKASLGLFVWAFLPLSLAPRIDGGFLPEDPAKLVINRNYNKVDLMAGITRDDGAFFLYLMSLNGSTYDALRDNFDELAPMSIGCEDEAHGTDIAREVYRHYMHGKPIGIHSNHQLLKVFSDSYFEHCYDVATRLHSRDINVYRYEFHHRGQFSIGDMVNVEESKDWIAHFDEMFYLFEGGELTPSKMEDPEDLKMRRILVKLWTNFAATGNPTPDDSLGFKWVPATPDNVRYLKITAEPSSELDKRHKMREFWLSLPYQQNEYLRHLFKEAKEEL